MKHRALQPTILLCLAVAAGIIALLSGCAMREVSPEEVAGSFCEALKDFDPEKMKMYLVHADEDTVDVSEVEANFADIPDIWLYLKDQISKLEYSVGEADIDGETATLVVRFTHTDISPAVYAATEEYLQQAFALALAGASQEAMEQVMYTSILSKLNSTSPITTSTDVDFTLLHMNGGWKIDHVSEDGFTNVVSCNLVNALSAFEAAEDTSLPTDEAEEPTDGDETGIAYEEAYEEESEEALSVQTDISDELSDFVGEWEAADGSYPFMEISPLEGAQCRIEISNKFGRLEAVGEYDQYKGVVMFFDGIYSTRDKGSDIWTEEEDGCSGWIYYESPDALRWYNTDEDYDQYFIRINSPMDEMELNGITYRDAVMDGWGYLWAEVCEQMGSDPSGYFEEAEEDPSLYGRNGNAWDDFTINGVTYEMALKHDWGDTWMEFSNHIGTGG